jgi:hypothetical protein
MEEYQAWFHIQGSPDWHSESPEIRRLLARWLRLTKQPLTNPRLAVPGGQLCNMRSIICSFYNLYE